MTTCTCGHHELSHTYQPSTRANDGRCLSRDCRCNRMEAAA